MATRDITEGRGSATSGVGRAIAVDLGIVSDSSVWSNTNISYDVAIGGMPFILATRDDHPYVRQTAPFRKEQSDTSLEPGEQSLTGWWMRSQASFHGGTGIKFYDPGQTDEVGHYRFADSDNIDVWTKGQVTLLKETANMTGVTTGIYKLISAMSDSTNVVVGYIPGSTTMKSFNAAGTVVTTYAPTNLGNILDGAVCTDGTRLFVADSDHIYTGPINAASAGWTEYYATGSRAILAWVKQRLVGCVTNSVYELTGATGGALALPTPLYTHPNTEWIWTSIAESGPAIYVAGYAGGNSAIYKFTLSTAGVMPTLTSGVVAAQLPTGEIVHKIEHYLGRLVIGTNKGVRVASIADDTGNLSYGPLVIEDSAGIRDFAFRGTYVWCAGTIGTFAGLYRMNLDSELEPLRFAYAKDTYLNAVTGYATSVDFVGNTDQIAFTTSGSNGIAIQSTTVLATTGSMTTGKIRFGTLEPKNFKRLVGRGVFTSGDFTMASIATSAYGTETEYDHISYNVGVPAVEVTTSQPESAQEFLAYKFTFARDTTDTTTGPTFKGYQAKATIATPRQRLFKISVWCYDVESDKFNAPIGYEGRVKDRIDLLENSIEGSGDVLTYQNLNTGESRQALIESVTFTGMTAPSKRFKGEGGIIDILLRTV